jgi:hypothetical protein
MVRVKGSTRPAFSNSLMATHKDHQPWLAAPSRPEQDEQ